MKKTLDSRIKQAVKPIWRRIQLRHFFKSSAAAAAAVILQSLVWMAISFFIPIVSLLSNILITGGIVFAGTLAVGWFLRPSILEAAREGDQHGLQERIITALELSGRSDVFAALQREDTVSALNGFNPQSISLSVPRRWIAALSVLALLLCGVMLLPNPQGERVKQIVKVQKEIDKQLKEMEADLEQEMAKDTELTDAQKKELMKMLKELSKKLRDTSDYKEALKEISKSEENLAELMKEARKAQMAALGEQLAQKPVTKALGEKVKQMDAKGIQEEIEKLQKLSEQDQQVNKEIMEALQKAIEEVSKQFPGTAAEQQLQELAESLKNEMAAGSQMSSQQLGQLGNQLAQLSQNVSTNPAGAQYMLQQMKSQIAQAAGQGNLQFAMGGENQSGDGSGQGQSSSGSGQQGSSENGGGQGNGDGNGNGSGDGSGSGSGNGSGNNSGSGSGDGSGGGAGVGNGHTNQDAGYQDYGSPSSGSTGEGNPNSYADYEKIYDPTRLGDGGDPSQVTGSPNGEGPSQQFEAGEGMGSFDGFIPYNEVFGNYRSQAMETLDRQAIPANMKEWVKGYFSSLED